MSVTPPKPRCEQLMHKLLEAKNADLKAEINRLKKKLQEEQGRFGALAAAAQAVKDERDEANAEVSKIKAESVALCIDYSQTAQWWRQRAKAWKELAKVYRWEISDPIARPYFDKKEDE